MTHRSVFRLEASITSVEVQLVELVPGVGAKIPYYIFPHLYQVTKDLIYETASIVSNNNHGEDDLELQNNMYRKYLPNLYYSTTTISHLITPKHPSYQPNWAGYCDKQPRNPETSAHPLATQAWSRT